ATRAMVVIDPNNPTGALYSTATRRALIEIAEQHGLAILADEVYGDLGFHGPIAPLGSLCPDAPLISFSSLSKGYLAPGWRTGWMAIGRSPRLDDVAAAVRKLADGRLCSTVPMQHAVAAALGGDRSHQAAFREALMLIYISALIAMGFSPLVRGIERPRKGTAPRVPRVFAILVIYLAIVAVIAVVGLMIVPPLVDQASMLWENMPRYFDRFQT